MPPAKINKYAVSSPITDATIGPMVWAGFLLRRFQCDLDALNTQLPIPIETDEVFEFGINPRPLPREDIPQLFQRYLYLGTNPDGNYAQEARYSDCDLEYDDYKNANRKSDEKLHPKKKLQFNLYKRVIARVPESKYWLFNELKPYFLPHCPQIDTSIKTFTDVCNELGLEIVEWRCMEKWEADDPESLRNAKTISLTGFINCALPETLALLFSTYHLAVWQNAGNHNNATIIEQLRHVILDTLLALTKSPVFSEIPNGENLAKHLYPLLSGSIRNIELYGMRSIATRLVPEVTNQLVFVKKSNDCAAAMRTLHLSGDRCWDGYLFDIISPDFVFPSSEEVAHAIDVLSQSANDVATWLELRSKENLKKFDRVRRYNKRSLEI